MPRLKMYSMRLPCRSYEVTAEVYRLVYLWQRMESKIDIVHAGPCRPEPRCALAIAHYLNLAPLNEITWSKTRTDNATR
jgi:hypothetical protein